MVPPLFSLEYNRINLGLNKRRERGSSNNNEKKNKTSGQMAKWIEEGGEDIGNEN